METFIVILFIVLVISYAWFFYCVEKTAKERTELIPAPEDENYWAKVDDWLRVGYKWHLAYRLMLINPNRLYSKKLFPNTKDK